MNAGKSYSKALEQAKANAQRTETNRYLWRYDGVYWVEKDRPNGAFGSFTYVEVHPDGTCEDKEATLEPQVRASREVKLEYNEEIDLVLPCGKKVSILLSYLEPDEQFPELDIKFSEQVSANCFLEALQPAVADPPNMHALMVRQIIVPIQPSESR